MISNLKQILYDGEILKKISAILVYSSFMEMLKTNLIFSKLIVFQFFLASLPKTAKKGRKQAGSICCGLE